jgi:hypothetical protein
LPVYDERPLCRAVACFAILQELLDALNRGKEIIFAEEAGSWMIPTDEKAWKKAYATSLAAIYTGALMTAFTPCVGGTTG